MVGDLLEVFLRILLPSAERFDAERNESNSSLAAGLGVESEFLSFGDGECDTRLRSSTRDGSALEAGCDADVKGRRTPVIP